MIKVAGCWELGWNTPLLEYPLWHFPLRDFKVDEWYMTPVSGIAKNGVIELRNMVEVIDANRHLEPVYVDEQGEASLQDFEHPADVLYIFGKAAYSPWREHGKQGRSVRIETPQRKALLWPHQCACLVLYDRMVKSWR